VLAIAIANLPPELRWNPENLILVSTLLGPAETKSDQIGKYLQPLVNELLVLWNAPQTVFHDELDDVDKVHDRRTVEEHRTAAAKYSTLMTEAEQAAFLKKKSS
ncbi:hypothetical protein FRC06_008991, partial [Ceratobasidium sp. 370]